MTNSICEGPRSMLPEQYDELMDLKEIAYGLTRQHFLNYFPHTAKRETCVFEDHFIIKQNDRIVSHVGLIPMEVVIGNSTIKCGGIGGVATHPDARGKGFMGKLLEYSVDKMKQRGIPLSILWGDTQRYRHFGWETAGRKIVFHLNKRSVKGIDVGREFTLRGYNPKEDLDLIAEIHEQEPLRVRRSRRDYEQMLERTQIQVWIGAEGGSRTYAALSGNKVIEFGGEPSTAAKLFSFMLRHYPFETLDIDLPYKESQMLNTLYKISSHWEVLPLGMIKVVDLKRALLSFKEQIREKAKVMGIDKGMCITLRMEDSRCGIHTPIRMDQQEASLIMADEMELKDEATIETVSLSDIEMVRLLFGPSAEDFTKNKRQRRLLTSLFPLDFYVWGLDHV